METPEKLYYSISEVNQITGVEAYTLRYWEKEFPKLRPKKSQKGQRTYTKKDIEVIQEIKRLLKDNKFTIKGAREKLKGYSVTKPAPAAERPAVPEQKHPSASSSSTPQSMKQMKDELLEMKKRLNLLIEQGAPAHTHA